MYGNFPISESGMLMFLGKLKSSVSLKSFSEQIEHTRQLYSDC